MWSLLLWQLAKFPPEKSADSLYREEDFSDWRRKQPVCTIRRYLATILCNATPTAQLASLSLGSGRFHVKDRENTNGQTDRQNVLLLISRETTSLICWNQICWSFSHRVRRKSKKYSQFCYNTILPGFKESCHNTIVAGFMAQSSQGNGLTVLHWMLSKSWRWNTRFGTHSSTEIWVWQNLLQVTYRFWVPKGWKNKLIVTKTTERHLLCKFN